jgi:hypothetical protein
VGNQELYRWPTNADVTFRLLLLNADGTPATGKAPTVQIRRERVLYGGALDLYWWDGAGFVNTVQKLALTEWDATNHPGSYQYAFPQSTLGLRQQYLVFFEHPADPVGSASESHLFTDEIFVTAGQTDPVTVTNQTVLGNLELLKDGGTGEYEPATDSMHALSQSVVRLTGLNRENSIYDRVTFDAFNQPTAGRLRVFDSASNVPTLPNRNETVGLQHEYEMAAQYAGQNVLVSFTLKRVK